ncbi:MAG: hypothetical protein NVS1B9_04880 [Solirubrobacteraceae bacterium]
MKRLLALATVFLCLGPAAAGAALREFQSPTGNIGCVMDSGSFGVQVRCDIDKHTWVAPPRPRSCMLDWGHGVLVSGSGRGRYVCAGDAALHLGPHLAYNRSITLGRLRCTSLFTGVRCLNRATGHGFTLARSHVSLH